MVPRPSPQSAPPPLIPEFYAGKDIFITGATGFIGKVRRTRKITVYFMIFSYLCLHRLFLGKEVFCVCACQNASQKTVGKQCVVFHSVSKDNAPNRHRGGSLADRLKISSSGQGGSTGHFPSD